jgi:hypothetical protein
MKIDFSLIFNKADSLIRFSVTKVDVFVTVQKSYVLLRQHFYLGLKVLFMLRLKNVTCN